MIANVADKNTKIDAATRPARKRQATVQSNIDTVALSELTDIRKRARSKVEKPNTGAKATSIKPATESTNIATHNIREAGVVKIFMSVSLAALLRCFGHSPDGVVGRYEINTHFDTFF